MENHRRIWYQLIWSNNCAYPWSPIPTSSSWISYATSEFHCYWTIQGSIQHWGPVYRHHHCFSGSDEVSHLIIGCQWNRWTHHDECLSTYTFEYVGERIVLHPLPPARRLATPIPPAPSTTFLVDCDTFFTEMDKNSEILCLTNVLDIPATTILKWEITCFCLIHIPYYWELSNKVTWKPTQIPWDYSKTLLKRRSQTLPFLLEFRFFFWCGFS